MTSSWLILILTLPNIEGNHPRLPRPSLPTNSPMFPNYPKPISAALNQQCDIYWWICVQVLLECPIQCHMKTTGQSKAGALFCRTINFFICFSVQLFLKIISIWYIIWYCCCIQQLLFLKTILNQNPFPPIMFRVVLVSYGPGYKEELN